jgi:hypothetical protein
VRDTSISVRCFGGVQFIHVRLHLNKTGSKKGRGEIMNIKGFALASIAVSVVVALVENPVGA